MVPSSLPARFRSFVPAGPCPAAVAAAALFLLSATGCASAPAAEPPAAAAEPAAEPAEGGPVTPEQLRETLNAATNAGSDGRRRAAATLDPENDESAASGWLFDAESGRRYYLARMPQEAIYRRMPDGTVRTRFGGIAIEPESEDADWIYYRVYDVSDIDPGVFRPRMTEEEKAAVAASYAFEARSEDRLRFEPFDEGLPNRGQWRQGFEIADMNGDGHLDIVHGPPRKVLNERPIVFLGDGAGRWRRWDASFPGQPRYDYGDVAVGDFDGDGRPDLALAMHLLGTTALVQREPGVFVAWNQGLDRQVLESEPLPYTARTIEAADWDGDGRTDLVVLGEGPKMSMGTRPEFGGESSYGAAVYLNQGDGSWRRIDRGTGHDQLFGDDLEVVDLDGDGRVDFVTGTSAMGRDDVLHLADGDTWRAEELDLRRLARVRDVATGDFDGDGRVDVAVAYAAYEGEIWRTGIDLFLRRDDGWSRRAVWNAESRESLSAVAAGDLDGDGRLDLVALTEEGGFRAWRGDGGGFVAEPSEEVATFPGCAGFHVEIRDLDGDGRGEVVAGYAGEAGSEIIFEPNAPSRCPTQGALTAYRSVPGGTGGTP